VRCTPGAPKIGIFQEIPGECLESDNWSVFSMALLGEITPSYILHTRAFETYLLGGVIYLAKKIIRWWYFTCKKPKNIICDGILHVNMFHYFKIPYFTCNFKKNYLQWIYWTLFLIVRCSTIFAQWSPRVALYVACFIVLTMRRL
jgi:hypothetical protein